MKIAIASAAILLVIFLLIHFLPIGPEQISQAVGPASHERNFVIKPAANRPDLTIMQRSRVVSNVLDKLGPGSSDFEIAVVLLKEHKDDLVASTIIMEWLMEQNPMQGIREIAGIYDKVNPAMEAAFRSFSIRHSEQAWELLSSTEDWRSRAMLTGMLSGMVKDASPERIASFLNTCSSGSFGIFLPQVVERLAPDGGISKLKTGLQLLESAKSRGLDVNQGVLTLFPWLFEIVRSEGVVQMEQAAAVISTSQLRFNSEAMAKFVEAYVRTDPQMAFEFVGNLPAETRASSVEAAARMLAMTNPESATDLAFNGNLTGEDQVTVMFQLHVAVGGPHGNYELFERTGSWLKANNKDVSKVDDRVGRPLPPIKK